MSFRSTTVADVFVERLFDPPLGTAELESMPRSRSARLSARGVTWRESFLDRSGRRMLCRFEAPDEASLRDALEQERVQVEELWAGTVHGLGGSTLAESTAAGESPVLVQHRVEEPITSSHLRTVESLCTWCLETHRIRLVRMLLSLDLRRIVYLYRAPDAESVRLAHRQAGLELDVVWPYHEVAGCLPDGRDGA
ncbi:MAG: hypothetical protein JXB36_04585 [Gammaproteobacteria bacterium]|nr:hypothetical protein [Gammaproteobacteria bacterium]